MSSIRMYAVEEDIKQIFDWLSQEEEIAFIIPNGPGYWKAVSNYTFQGGRTYPLWHVPSGPLPLVHEDDRSIEDYVPDPWKGWKEEVEYKEFSPWFGPSSSTIGIINFTVRPESHVNKPQVGLFMPGIGISAFGWVGNHCSTIGKPALQSTEKFWAKLRRWVQKQAIKVPIQGAIDGPKPVIWAFPHALEKIKKGYPRNWL